MAVTDLSPILRESRDRTQDYAMSTANNAFDKAFFARRGSRSMQDFSKGFNRELPSYTAGQLQRGLGGGGVQSGVMNRAMRNYVGDYTQQLGRMQDDYNLGLNRFDFTQGVNTDNYNLAMSDLESQKANAIAMTADVLSRLRQQLGGMF